MEADDSRTSPAKRGRPRDPGLDEVILTSTLNLLVEVGYARLTMDHVARRAGVSKASLYLRWPAKVALVAAALQHRSGAVPEIPDTGTVREDMRRFLCALLHSRRAAGKALTAVSGEIATNPELREAWHRGLAGSLAACIRAILVRAIERGELPQTTDVELLSLVPLTVFQQWRLSHEQDPDEAVVERIVHQFFAPRGMTSDASPGRDE